jgi:hypothetical protein
MKTPHCAFLGETAGFRVCRKMSSLILTRAVRISVKDDDLSSGISGVRVFRAEDPAYTSLGRSPGTQRPQIQGLKARHIAVDRSSTTFCFVTRPHRTPVAFAKAIIISPYLLSGVAAGFSPR